MTKSEARLRSAGGAIPLIVLVVAALHSASSCCRPRPAPHENDLQAQFTVGAQVIGTFEGSVSRGIVRFSRDARHFAYCSGRPGDEFVVIDGIAGPRCKYILGVPEFANSPTTSCVYIGQVGGKRHLFVNHSVIGAWDDVSCQTFSEDGRVLAYATAQGGRWKVTIGEREIDAPGRVWRLTVDSDGSSFAFLAQTKDAWVVRFNDSSWQYPDVAGVSVSPDGHRVAFAAASESGWTLCVDGTSVATLKRLAGFVWSFDSRDFAWIEEADDGYRVHFRDEESPSFDWVSHLSILPDNSGVVFAARETTDWETREFVVSRGERSSPFRQILEVAVARRSGTVAWVAVNEMGSQVVACGSWRSPPHEIWALRIHPDGKHVGIAYPTENQIFWEVYALP